MAEKIVLKTVQECENSECGFRGRAEIHGALSDGPLFWICEQCNLQQLDQNPLGRSQGETVKANNGLSAYWTFWQNDEGNKSYRRFVDATPGMVFDTIRSWSRRYYWKARIARQHGIIVAERITAILRENQREATDLAMRRKGQRQLELKDAELMRERARAVLREWPFTETIAKTNEAGQPLEIVKPAGSSEIRAASAMLETASKLERGALEMPIVSKSEVIVRDWRDEFRRVGIDPVELLERIVSGMAEENGDDDEHSDP